jgi:hypothetical protein
MAKGQLVFLGGVKRHSVASSLGCLTLFGYHYHGKSAKVSDLSASGPLLQFLGGLRDPTGSTTGQEEEEHGHDHNGDGALEKGHDAPHGCFAFSLGILDPSVDAFSVRACSGLLGGESTGGWGAICSADGLGYSLQVRVGWVIERPSRRR